MKWLSKKAMVENNFAQALLGINKVLTGEADTNPAQILLRGEAKLAYEKSFERTHGTVGNCSKRIVEEEGAVYLAIHSVPVLDPALKAVDKN